MMADYSEAYDAPRRRAIRFDPTRGRAHVHEQAERHSRRVRWLRLVLPALAAASVVGFVVATQIDTTSVGGGLESVVSMAGINIEEKSLVMKAPHISGFEGTKQAYEVQAERAIQELDNPKVVKLDEIIANFGMGRDGTATVNAKAGVFDGNRNRLRLNSGIIVTTSAGYTAKLVSADIDVTKGGLVSKKPLEIKATQGTLKANAVEVQERGKRIIFSGGVTVVYYPKSAGAAPDTEKQAQASAGQ